MLVRPGHPFDVAHSARSERGFHFLAPLCRCRALRSRCQLERELKATKALQTKSLDHFSLEDLEVEQIDDRNIKIALVRGDKEAAFNLKFPVVLNRGVWNERAHYDKGDGVTHGGSWWIARKDSPGRPGDGTWQLTVKRGSDGKAAGA